MRLRILSSLVFSTFVFGCVDALVYPIFPRASHNPWLQIIYQFSLMAAAHILRDLSSFILHTIWIRIFAGKGRDALPCPSLLDRYCEVFIILFNNASLDYDAFLASRDRVGKLIQRSSISAEDAHAINQAITIIEEDQQELLNDENTEGGCMALLSEIDRWGKYIMVTTIQRHDIDSNKTQRQAFYDLQTLLKTFFTEPRNEDYYASIGIRYLIKRADR
ncbi:hypothetical protein BDP27DRAFT_1328019 [Rhodocollybia butyracea]|uniref:Uncharacterized protein n=1 Tax=Rhodocollybia butyracea TaxID=206335 RepID=A0A9P5U6F4_9AGAR|nr:hypothetical protein BDP27DRAFT_1328019 [Rhodocollybia butyracea]